MGECRKCRWWDEQHEIVALMMHAVGPSAVRTDAGICTLAEDEHQGVQFTVLGEYYDEQGTEDGHLLTAGTFGCNQWAPQES